MCTKSMDETLNRRHGQSLGPNSILKSIIKIEGFQLNGKRTIKYTPCFIKKQPGT